MTTYLGSIHDSPIWQDIADERDRQDQIGRDRVIAGLDWRSCADPAMVGGDPMRYVVLGEEYGEVGRALLEQRDRAGELRAELVQVAAVAVAWIEAIDRAPEIMEGTP